MITKGADVLNNKKGFFDLVSRLVDEHKREKGLSYHDIAELLNVSESQIKKIHSYSSDRKYKLIQLVILAHHWELNVEEFIPTSKTLKKLGAYQTYTEEELDQFCKELYSNISSEVLKEGEE